MRTRRSEQRTRLLPHLHRFDHSALPALAHEALNRQHEAEPLSRLRLLLKPVAPRQKLLVALGAEAPPPPLRHHLQLEQSRIHNRHSKQLGQAQSPERAAGRGRLPRARKVQQPLCLGLVHKVAPAPLVAGRAHRAALPEKARRKLHAVWSPAITHTLLRTFARPTPRT
jgi:hypothetical protein